MAETSDQAFGIHLKLWPEVDLDLQGPHFHDKQNLYWLGTSLVVQWLRLCTPNAGEPGSIPGQN